MKVLPGVSVSRVMSSHTDGSRAWHFPFFGVRVGRRWYFPLGFGPIEGQEKR